MKIIMIMIYWMKTLDIINQNSLSMSNLMTLLLILTRGLNKIGIILLKWCDFSVLVETFVLVNVVANAYDERLSA